MGCASSKQSRCRHCRSPYSPLPRSYSVPVHHPAQSKGDTHHVVALTSTTLGSLKLDSLDQKHRLDDIYDDNDDDLESTTTTTTTINNDYSKEFSMEVSQAKTWSNMINEKIPKIIPKTPIRTPPGEPETINTWELMEGLEDASPLRLPNLVQRCFSFHTVPDSTILDQPKSKLQETGTGSPKQLWLQMRDTSSNQNSDPNITDFDPEIISTFRKALEELSPMNTVHIRSPENEKTALPKDAMDTKKVKNGTTLDKCPPRGEDKVVIYFTSLRGVRKTYEDCCHVRVILKGFRVRVDERDVSMHYGFREELKEVLGAGFGGGLPRVFVKGSYIGGAEEVRQMHEDGELEKILEGCEVVEEGGGGGGGGVCEVCGDVRFVPCERCSGSCKIYYEDGDGDDGDEEEEEGREGGFLRCPDCNENGIVLCPVCCY